MSKIKASILATKPKVFNHLVDPQLYSFNSQRINIGIKNMSAASAENKVIEINKPIATTLKVFENKRIKNSNNSFTKTHLAIKKISSSKKLI